MFLRSWGQDCVVPLGMKFVPAQSYRFEFFVRHFDPFFVLMSVQHGLDLEAGARLGGSDPIDDRFVVDQRHPLPVQADKRKEPVLDLVPLAGAGRVVTNRDRDRHLAGQLVEVDLPCPEPMAVAAPRIRADQ